MISISVASYVPLSLNRHLEVVLGKCICKHMSKPQPIQSKRYTILYSQSLYTVYSMLDNHPMWGKCILIGGRDWLERACKFVSYMLWLCKAHWVAQCIHGWWHLYLQCHVGMYHWLIAWGWLVKWQPFSKVTQRGGPPSKILRAGHLGQVISELSASLRNDCHTQTR